MSKVTTETHGERLPYVKSLENGLTFAVTLPLLLFVIITFILFKNNH